MADITDYSQPSSKELYLDLRDRRQKFESLNFIWVEVEVGVLVLGTRELSEFRSLLGGSF
jgi:hypothetical protein